MPRSKGARVNSTTDPLRTLGRITNSLHLNAVLLSSSLENITAAFGSMAQMGYLT
jgi:hypothetical protein